ncbi:MAG TPA: hypothetical protein VLS89_20375 [Candidatus Nanopelagicales bacterium]|nr:hypothetical protein [Candidatus Nanopelagicales bacterium]
MASRVKSRGKHARLSSEAQAWELERLRELGLSDVTWDHERWCPRCRAVGDPEQRLRAARAAPNWRLPSGKGTEEAHQGDEGGHAEASPPPEAPHPRAPQPRRTRGRRRRPARE